MAAPEPFPSPPSHSGWFFFCLPPPPLHFYLSPAPHTHPGQLRPDHLPSEDLGCKKRAAQGLKKKNTKPQTSNRTQIKTRHHPSASRGRERAGSSLTPHRASPAPRATAPPQPTSAATRAAVLTLLCASSRSKAMSPEHDQPLATLPTTAAAASSYNPGRSRGRLTPPATHPHRPGGPRADPAPAPSGRRPS